MLLLGGGLALRAGVADSWFGMRAGQATRAEWHAFTADAVAQLQQLDASLAAPALVVVDPLSGFGQEVVGRPWRQLRFVQPTPATPLGLHTVDYLLVTPGARYVTEELPAQWGPQPPVVQVDSAHRRFGLQLFDNPRRG